MKRKNIIPYEPVGRLMQEAGAKRVSHEAKVEMAQYLTEFSFSIARLAAKYAEHAGRSTITGKDIELAAKNLEKRS